MSTIKYIKGFDALRALSVAFVMLNHLGLDGFLGQGSFARERLWHLFSGETGVHIFFVISGFLITSILISEQERTGRIRFGYFFARRFLRLLPPLLLLFTAVAILMGVGIVKPDVQALLMSFFYLYNYVPLQHYVNELAHTWSLGVEEQFYLLWPFLLSRLREYKKILLICAFLSIVSAMSLLLFPDYAFRAHLRPKRWFIPAAGHIFIGCIFAIIYIKAFISREKLQHPVIFVLFLLLYAAPVYVPLSLTEAFSLIQSAGVGFLLLWICCNQEHWLVRFMDFGPFSYFGKISYGLYVFQGLFLTTGYGSPYAFQQYPQNVVFTFAAAIVSYHVIEKPVLRLRQHFRV